GHRLPGLQGEAGRSPGRAAEGDPRAPPGIRCASRHGVGHPARGLQEGAGGGRGHDAGRAGRDEDPLLSDEPEDDEAVGTPPAEAQPQAHAEAAAEEPLKLLEGVESILPEDVPKIHVQEFEGPLDLLLYLIRRNKVDIHDIPIAPITRQYVEYLELMKE